jgi:pantoate--beta-alanine ligase
VIGIGPALEKIESIKKLRVYLREQRAGGRSISLVPTMGALHAGHRSCVDVAGSHGDLVVVSIFVNQTQFGPNEDFKKYPRPLDDDLELCRMWGVDVVFVPSPEEMYPVEQTVWVEVGGLSEKLCARNRPGHFRGVTTVVMKLFDAVQPDVAVFGQKDAQQVLVVNEMVRQLNYPVAITLSPTVREPDGLAVSSRNRYLSPEERHRAAGIHRALLSGSALVVDGERTPARVVEQVRRVMEDAGISDIEYVDLLNARNLESPSRVEGRILLAVAAKVGTTRLIDNIVLNVGDDTGVHESLLF